MPTPLTVWPDVGASPGLAGRPCVHLVMHGRHLQVAASVLIGLCVLRRSYFSYYNASLTFQVRTCSLLCTSPNPAAALLFHHLSAVRAWCMGRPVTECAAQWAC